MYLHKTQQHIIVLFEIVNKKKNVLLCLTQKHNFTI